MLTYRSTSAEEGKSSTNNTINAARQRDRWKGLSANWYISLLRVLVSSVSTRKGRRMRFCKSYMTYILFRYQSTLPASVFPCSATSPPHPMHADVVPGAPTTGEKPVF